MQLTTDTDVMMRANMFRVIGLLCLVILGGACKAGTGDAPPPADVRTPNWNRRGQLPDGRIFVTDGAIAMDAQVVHVETMPTESLTEKQSDWLQSLLATPQPTEFDDEDLTYDANLKVWKGPGVRLNPRYVAYLRNIHPGGGLRFRANRPTDPVSILMRGAIVGVLMPMDPGK